MMKMFDLRTYDAPSMKFIGMDAGSIAGQG